MKRDQSQRGVRRPQRLIEQTAARGKNFGAVAVVLDDARK
jgi:hypothetical protein